MTIADFTSTSTPGFQVLWISPDVNLWVAQGSGEFIGMVEFTDGHFVSTDRAGALIETFAGLPEAKAAVAMHAAMLASFGASGRKPRPAVAVGARVSSNFYRRSR